jgi:membrane protein required for colicin V production
MLIVLLGLLAVRLSRAMLMGWTDRLLGGAVGLLKGAAAGVALVAVLTLFLPSKSKILTDSLLSGYALRASHYLVQLFPEHLRHRFKQRKGNLPSYLTPQQITRQPKSIEH